MNMIRALLQYPSLTQNAEDSSVRARAETLVRMFYILMPFMAFLFFTTHPTPYVQNFLALWPLFWADVLSLHVDAIGIAVRAFFLASALVGLALYRHRFARLLVFIGIWQAHAFISSFGEPNHQWYPWVIVALIFVFLPDRDAEYRGTLLVVWWAQAYLALSYTMAGVWKVLIALQQFVLGEIHGFSIVAFSYQVADWLPRIQNEALLGPYIIEHPFIAWPFYVLSHLFQLFTFWILFRPSLQRVWAFELIVFHMATYLTMGILFVPLIPLILLLFYMSPFIPAAVSARQIFFDLPIIGQIAKRFAHRHVREH